MDVKGHGHHLISKSITSCLYGLRETSVRLAVSQGIFQTQISAV
jgi:hypothetical protein